MAALVRRSNRLVLGLTVGALVFAATFAAAASLNLSVETLSADQAAIVSCDPDGVTSDYGTVYSATAGGYIVAGVDLSGIAGPCNLFDFKVSLVGAGGAQLAQVSTPAANLGGSGNARTLANDFSGANVRAEDVISIAVSITDPS